MVAGSGPALGRSRVGEWWALFSSGHLGVWTISGTPAGAEMRRPAGRVGLRVRAVLVVCVGGLRTAPGHRGFRHELRLQRASLPRQTGCSADRVLMASDDCRLNLGVRSIVGATELPAWRWLVRLVIRALQSIRATRRPLAAIRSGVQRNELSIRRKAKRTALLSTPWPQASTAHPRRVSSQATHSSWASPAIFLS